MITVIGIKSETRIRQMDWAEENRKKVAEYSGGTIGYIHAASMNPIGIQDLERWFDLENKENGLVVDMRWNGGGLYEGSVVDRMFRSSYGQFVWGNQAYSNYPTGVRTASRVVLINGHTQSSGEGVAIGARHRGAYIIGSRTWGGYSSTADGKDQVDGGFVGVTGLMWKDHNGLGYIENKGLEPDLQIYNPILGGDHQLKEAIDYLMKGQETP